MVLFLHLFTVSSAFPEADEQIAYDSDGNGVEETREFYRNGSLERLEWDINQDGNTDLTCYYRDDHMIRAESCFRYGELKFNEQINWWKYFRRDIPIMEKRDRNDDGDADWILHYQRGNRSKLEMDTNFDLNMDHWEYFENGVLVRIEIDSDGDGRVDRVEQLKPNPPTGPITFQTKPAGAMVTIDRKTRGRTPLTLKLTAGSHNIRLSMNGYEAITYTMSFQPGKPYIINYALRPSR